MAVGVPVKFCRHLINILETVIQAAIIQAAIIQAIVIQKQ